MALHQIGIANQYNDDRDPNYNTAQQQVFTAQGGANYQDAHGYNYTYDPATQEFTVLGYGANRYWDVAGQREFIKRIHATNVHLHIYYPSNSADPNPNALPNVNDGNQINRYYYDLVTHRYQQVPQLVAAQGARPVNTVWWRHDNDNFVDGYGRVRTNNGEFVRKHYCVSKHGQNFVVPFKLVNQRFAPALPALFGGNMDPDDGGPANTLTRETDEESRRQYAFVAITGEAMPTAQDIIGHNELTFATGTVAPALNPLAPLTQRSEMAGTFTFTVADFAGGNHTADPAAFRARLLGLYQAFLGLGAPAGAPTLPAFVTQMLGPAATPVQVQALQDWANSHSMEALYRVVSDEVGLEDVKNSALNTAAPGVVGILHNQAWTNYIAGLQAVQLSVPTAPLPALSPVILPAHRQAWIDYRAGLQAVQQSAPAALVPALGGAVTRAYLQAWTDYTAGEQAVRQAVALNSAVAPAAARSHKVAWADYIAGVSNPNVIAARRAYQLAQGQYQDGHDAARDGTPLAGGQTLAYRTGYASFHSKQQRTI